MSGEKETLTLEEAMPVSVIPWRDPVTDPPPDDRRDIVMVHKGEDRTWLGAASVVVGRPEAYRAWALLPNFAEAVARDEASDLGPVGDRLSAYNDLLSEWQGRKRTYGKHEASHPKRLREAMQQADEAGLPLVGNAIQSLVFFDAVASNRAAHLEEHYAAGLKAAGDEASELRAALASLLTLIGEIEPAGFPEGHWPHEAVTNARRLAGGENER